MTTRFLKRVQLQIQVRGYAVALVDPEATKIVLDEVIVTGAVA